jgi:hypothetical protein
MRWTGNVEHMGEMRNVQNLIRKTEGKKHLEDLGVEGRTISK